MESRAHKIHENLNPTEIINHTVLGQTQPNVHVHFYVCQFFDKKFNLKCHDVSVIISYDVNNVKDGITVKADDHFQFSQILRYA